MVPSDIQLLVHSNLYHSGLALVSAIRASKPSAALEGQEVSFPMGLDGVRYTDNIKAD